MLQPLFVWTQLFNKMCLAAPPEHAEISASLSSDFKKPQSQNHWALIYMFIVHHLGLTAETASLIPVISNGEKQGEGSDKPGRRKDPPWPTIRIIEKLEASPQCSTHLCVRVAPS